jgi:hypothetical protein
MHIQGEEDLLYRPSGGVEEILSVMTGNLQSKVASPSLKMRLSPTLALLLPRRLSQLFILLRKMAPFWQQE